MKRCTASGRNREQNKRTARVADRPHQLQRFLGQPAPRLADRRRLRPDAGVTPQSRAHQLCPSSCLDAPRAVAQTGCPCAGFGSPRGRAPARVIPVPAHLPASGAGTGCLTGITCPRAAPKHNFSNVAQAAMRKSLARTAPLHPLRTRPSPPPRQINQHHVATSIFAAKSLHQPPLSAPS